MYILPFDSTIRLLTNLFSFQIPPFQNTNAEQFGASHLNVPACATFSVFNTVDTFQKQCSK